MNTVYQFVVPANAPGQPARHFFTKDAAMVARAPVGSIICVIAMTDEQFSAIPATPESAVFFG